MGQRACRQLTIVIAALLGHLRHLSCFFVSHFVLLAVNPFYQDLRGNPYSYCQGIALCSVEKGTWASPNPVGNQFSCLFRGRPPKYRKIQQEDFQSKCVPLPRCLLGAKVRLGEQRWWLAEAGLSLARSVRPCRGQHQAERLCRAHDVKANHLRRDVHASYQSSVGSLVTSLDLYL